MSSGVMIDDIARETIPEHILELLSHNVHVQEAIATEVNTRFPTFLDMKREEQEEINCIVAVGVYKRILEGVV